MCYDLSIAKRYSVKGGEKMNRNKLLAVIAEHGETQKDLAEALGITRVTLSRKISEHNNAFFTQPEMSIIKRRYNLSDEAISAIFFAD